MKSNDTFFCSVLYNNNNDDIYSLPITRTFHFSEIEQFVKEKKEEFNKEVKDNEWQGSSSYDVNIVGNQFIHHFTFHGEFFYPNGYREPISYEEIYTFISI